MELLSDPGRIFPERFTVDNYIRAWNSDSLQIGRMFINSVLYTLGCVMIMLIEASLYGYVFARGKFRGKRILFLVFSSLMFINLGSITIYPLLEVLASVKLKSSLWALLVYKIFAIPIVNIYLVKSYIQSLPIALDEAAKIDGCGFVGIFFRIIRPMLKPIMATIGMLSFNSSWNEYLFPAVFTMAKPEQQTLIVGIIALKNSSESAVSWDLMFAGTTISLIPVLLAFAFANRYFVKGIAMGALKG
jgi:ABC-type sugar transport system, permease component